MMLASFFQKKANPLFFSLLSGVLISIGTSTFTGAFSGDVWPKRWPFLLLAGVSFVGSGIICAILSWYISHLKESEIRLEQDQSLDLFKKLHRKLILLLVSSVIAVITGFVILLFGY